MGIFAPIERYSGNRYFQSKKTVFQSSISDPVYFNTLFLVKYLSAIKILICRREMSLIGSTSYDFAQNMIHDLSNYGIEVIVALSECHKKPFENIEGKGENTGSMHFLLFPQSFQPFLNKISVFHSFCLL